MATHSDSISNLNNPARGSGSNRSTTLGEQSQKVAEDVRELGNIALSSAGEAVKSVKERGNEALGEARERGQELLDKGRAGVTRARDGFENYVSENPFRSVLIAAGIGALIGYSLRNRN